MDPTQVPAGSTNRRRDVGAIVAAFRKAAETGEPVDPSLHDLKGLSFLGLDLSNLDLSNCDLTGADLSRCDLRNTTCAHAIFDRGILFQAKLDGAEFLSASFQEANLSQCTARKTGFGQSNLANAKFAMSDLSGSTFVNARANDVDFRTCKFEGARFLEADLTSADFSQSDLRGVDFQQANLKDAVFSKASLRGSRLRGVKNYQTAYWIDADIREIDFSGAYLVRRHIVDENFLHEFRHQSGTHRFILGNGEIALEIKSTDNPTRSDLKGLNAWGQEHPKCRRFLVCRVARPRRTSESVEILPWQDFLELLWAGKIQ